MTVCNRVRWLYLLLVALDYVLSTRFAGRTGELRVDETCLSVCFGVKLSLVSPRLQMSLECKLHGHMAYQVCPWHRLGPSLNHFNIWAALQVVP